MKPKFGRGGKDNVESSDTFDKYTEPAPLDMLSDRRDVITHIETSKPPKEYGPSGNRRTYTGPDSSYSSRGQGDRHRADTTRDYSDMEVTDQLSDKELAALRKSGYRLSNRERANDIRHKNDFNKIVKIILICFALIVGFSFVILIGVIALTSVRTGQMTETGIINGILQFIADIMKIGLS